MARSIMCAEQFISRVVLWTRRSARALRWFKRSAYDADAHQSEAYTRWELRTRGIYADR